MTKESVALEIDWYNRELKKVASKFTEWVKELGYSISRQEEKTVETTEELSGTYSTTQFELLLDETLKLSLVPYGNLDNRSKGAYRHRRTLGHRKASVFYAGRSRGICCRAGRDVYHRDKTSTPDILKHTGRSLVLV